MKRVMVVPNGVELERAMVSLGLQALPPEIEARVLEDLEDDAADDDEFDVFQSMHEGRRRRPTREV